MIQRKQTIWLLLAALFNAGLFFFDLYRAHIMENNVDTLKQINVSGHYPLLLMALVITALPLVAIFLFKNRKRQRAVTVFSVVAVVGFISVVMMRVTNFAANHPTATNNTYWIGSVLPVISIVFLIMAIRGINKDEKLVKSQDRLR